jgi:hypothetical protein
MYRLDRMHFPNETAYMTQVTIRRVEESWVAKAKADAAERGVSMNQVLVDALQRGLGVGGELKTNGLEKFSGDSKDSLGPEWDTYLEELKVVNPEDWK